MSRRRRPSRAPGVAVVVWIVVAVALGGCVRVKPHERALLGSPLMAPDPDPVERKIDANVRAYREGATGGTGVRGGGCGCN